MKKKIDSKSGRTKEDYITDEVDHHFSCECQESLTAQDDVDPGSRKSDELRGGRLSADLFNELVHFESMGYFSRQLKMLWIRDKRSRGSHWPLNPIKRCSNHKDDQNPDSQGELKSCYGIQLTLLKFEFMIRFRSEVLPLSANASG